MANNIDTNMKEYITNNRKIRKEKADRIIKLMESSDEINHLLQLTGRSHLYFSSLDEIIWTNSRLLFNIFVRERTSHNRQRLYIDVIHGVPTFEQVADCVYKLGTQANQRMIIYDVDFDFHPEGHPGSIGMVADLIALANAKGMPFSLVHAKNLYGTKNGRISYELNVDAFWVKREAPREYPTWRQLLEGEFWSFYYHLHFVHQGASPVDRLDIALGPWEPGYCIGDIRTKAIWNDDGLFMRVEGRHDDEGMTFLKDHVNLLQDEYPGCPIGIEDGYELALSVRVLDVPMLHLINMTPEKKWNYGEYLYNAEQHFADVVQEAFIKCDQTKDSKKAA